MIYFVIVAGWRNPARVMVLTVRGATDSSLRVHLEALQVLLAALIRVAPHHELIRIIRMFRHVHDRVIDDIIRVF